MGRTTETISLQFVADSRQIKQELNSLSTQLKNLGDNIDLTKKLSPQMQQAREDLIHLRAALQDAVNVDTGKIDFLKLSKSFKESNLSVTQIKNSLQQLGAAGEQAFSTLTKSIVEAEIPAKRANKLLSSMFESLKNTAKWQLSSSMLQGFTGAIREAYDYAKQLNKTLTDIKIVSDLSSQELEHFAKVANKAAKNLNTTTKEYAQASLIFFQQGLNEQEVLKRTNIVIKMANVTGEAVDDVSSYMTAIWNNFDNGSKSLEHYADVITALGAATASSTEEIAGGLEKFASIAETVGLSYEYAASALATVVSATRQSEETVGTAFKTIFGRLQSLNLGETLEDDTTLTKYTNAMLAVGINIQGANGELKSMNDILDEMGGKWNTLSNSQKVALANTVAGTRQYANFISLMDNYQSSFKDNVNIALEAQGELNKQSDEYASGWEAAQKRVRASAEAIYTQLINDDFFIDLNNGLAKFLDGFSVVIKGFGGLKGLLPSVLTLMSNLFSDKIARGLEGIAHNLGMAFGIVQSKAMKTKEEFVTANVEMLNQAKTTGAYTSEADNQRTVNLVKNIDLQKDFYANQEKMSAVMRAEVQAEMSISQELGEQVVALKEIVEQKQQAYSITKQEAQKQLATAKNLKAVYDQAKTDSNDKINELDAQIDNNNKHIHKPRTKRKDKQKLYQQNRSLSSDKNTLVKDMQDLEKAVSTGNVEETKRLLEEIAKLTGQTYQFKIEVTDDIIADLNQINAELMALKQANKIDLLDKNSSTAIEDATQSINQLKLARDGLKRAGMNTTLDEDIKALETLRSSLKKTEIGTDEYQQLLQEFNNKLTEIQANSLPDFDSTIKSLATSLGMTEDALRDLIQTNMDYNKSTRDADEGAENYEKQIQKLKQKIAEAAQEQKSWADITVTVATSMMGVVSMINQLHGINDIIEDDTMTTWEKMGALITMVASATLNLIQVMKSTKMIMDAVSAAKAKKAAVTKLNNLTQKQENKLTDEGNKKGKKDDTITKSVTKSKEREAKARLKNAGAKKIEQKGETVSDGGQINIGSSNSSKSKSNSSSGSEGAGLGAALGKMALAAVAVAAIVGTIAWIADKYNEVENSAKQAEARATDLKAHYEEVQQAYESLKSSVNNYNDLINGMDKIIEGTQEWKESLMQANQEARKIIETGKLMYGEDYTISEGLIKLKEGAVDTALENQLKETQQALATSIGADYMAKQMRHEANKVVFARTTDSKYENFSEDYSFLKANAGGLVAGAAIGTMISPGYGTLIGAGVGQLLGMAGGLAHTAIQGENTEEEQEAFNKMADVMADLTEAERETILSNKDNMKDFLTNTVKLDDKPLIDSLSEDLEGTRDLIESQIALKTEAIAATQAILQLNENFKEYFGEGAAGDYASEEWSKEYGLGTDAFNKYVQQYVDKYAHMTYFGSDSEFETWVSTQTNGALQITDTWGTDVTVKRRNEDGTYDVIDQEDDVSKEDFIRTYMETYLVSSEDWISQTNSDIEADKNKVNNAVTDVKKLGLDLDSELIDQIALDYVRTNGTVSTNLFSKFTASEVQKILDNPNIQSSAMGQAIYNALLDFDTVLKNRNAEALDTWHESTKIRDDNNRDTILKENNFTKEGLGFYVDTLSDANPELKNYEGFLEKVALRNLQLASSVKGVNEVLSEHIDTLISGEKTSVEYAEAMQKIGEALKQTFGVDFDAQFIADNLDLIIKMASGDTTALQKFGVKVAGESAKAIDYLSTDETKILTDFASTNLDAISTLTTGQSIYNSGIDFTEIDNLLKNKEIDPTDLANYLKNLGFEMVTQKNEDGTISLDKNNTRFVGTSTLEVNVDDVIEAFSQKYSKSRVNTIKKDKLQNDYEKLQREKEQTEGEARAAIITAQKENISKQIAEQTLINANNEAELQKTANKINEVLKTQETGIEAVFDEDNNLIGFKDQTGKELSYEDIMNNPIFLGQQEAIESALSDYESSVSVKFEGEKALEDIEEFQDELEREELEVDLELNVLVNDTQASNYDFKLSLLDGAEDSFERMAIYGSQTRLSQEKVDTYYQSLNDRMAKYSNGKYGFSELLNMTQADFDALGMSPEDREALQKDLNELKSGAQDYFKNKKAMETELMNYMSYVITEMNTGLKQVDALQGFLNSYQNLINILGKDFLGISNDFMSSLNEANVNLSKTNLTMAKDNYDTALQMQQKAYDNLQAIQNDEMSEETKAYWQSVYDEATNQVNAAKGEFLASWQEALEAAVNLFSSSVNIAIEEMEKALANGFGNLGYVQTAFNQQTALANQNLDTYTKMYEINKLNRQINTQLNNPNMLRGKKELKLLQEQLLAYQADGVEMNEYDLSILQKQYELEMAKIALEENRNAKMQVRLQQNASGGLEYIYTASEDAISEAEQRVQDIQYEIQKLRQEYINNMSSDILTLMQDFSTSLNEIALDNSLDDETRKKRISELYEFTLAQIEHSENILNSALGSSDMSIEDTILGKVFGLNKDDSITDIFRQTGTDAITDIYAAFNTLSDQTEDIYSAAGLSAGETLEQYLNNEIFDRTEGIMSASEEHLAKAQERSADLINTYSILVENMKVFHEEFDGVTTDLLLNTNTTIDAFERLITLMTGKTLSFKWEMLFDDETIEKGVASHDTGGYTGAWGKEGKFLLAHEKELILNQSDTKNMLKMIEMVRDMENTMGQLPNINPYGELGTVLAGLEKDVLEQNVSIQASFPNVVNRTDIEDAFENIVNMASQYAHRY